MKKALKKRISNKPKKTNSPIATEIDRPAMGVNGYESPNVRFRITLRKFLPHIDHVTFANGKATIFLKKRGKEGESIQEVKERNEGISKQIVVDLKKVTYQLSTIDSTGDSITFETYLTENDLDDLKRLVRKK